MGIFRVTQCDNFRLAKSGTFTCNICSNIRYSTGWQFYVKHRLVVLGIKIVAVLRETQVGSLE